MQGLSFTRILKDTITGGVATCRNLGQTYLGGFLAGHVKNDRPTPCVLTIPW